MPEQRHFTTRRGFIAALGFGAVSLYGAWAAYGAAPLPFGGRKGAASPHADGGDHGNDHGGDHGGDHGESQGGGHGGHGNSTGAAAGDFRHEHDAFVRKHTQPGGGVNPHAGESADGHDDHDRAAGGEPVDVYLLAQRFAYSPDILHLRAGVPYRFRMMADDITHGASIQLGIASRIIRLRPGIVTEQTLTFTEPGAYLVYCTVYCGQAHDAMLGRIIVA